MNIKFLPVPKTWEWLKILNCLYKEFITLDCRKRSEGITESSSWRVVLRLFLFFVEGSGLSGMKLQGEKLRLGARTS